MKVLSKNFTIQLPITLMVKITNNLLNEFSHLSIFLFYEIPISLNKPYIKLNYLASISSILSNISFLIVITPPNTSRSIITNKNSVRLFTYIFEGHNPTLLKYHLYMINY